jgi:hypothetical protein
MQTNSLGATLQSVYGTVGSVASTITTTFSTIEGGVQMINEVVKNAQSHQRKRNAGTEAIFIRRLKAELSADQARLELAIQQERKDPEFAKLFDAAFAEVSAAIDAA